MGFLNPQISRSVVFSLFFIYRFISMGIIEYPDRRLTRIISFVYVLIISLSCGYVSNFISDEFLVSGEVLGSPMARLYYIMYYMLSVGLVVNGLIVSAVNLKEHNACIVELAGIEKAVKSLTDIISYESLIIQEMRQFFCTVAILSIPITLDYITLSEIFQSGTFRIAALCYLLHAPTSLTTFVSFTITIINKMITQHFKSLNTLLESMRITNPADYTRLGNLIRIEAVLEDKERLEKLRRIRIIHTRLVKLAKRWVKLNAVYILSSIGLITCKLILDVYVVYFMATRGKYHYLEKLVCVCRAFSTIVEITKLCVIVFPTASMITEEKRTGSILLQELEPVAHLRSEIHQFSLQLIQNPFRLSPGGFVNLDRSLICMIITTAVTYLVVLIQTYADNQQSHDSSNSSHNSSAEVVIELLAHQD